MGWVVVFGAVVVWVFEAGVTVVATVEVTATVLCVGATVGFVMDPWCKRQFSLKEISSNA